MRGLVCLAAALSAAAFGLGCGSEEQGEPATIALLAPKTGPLSGVGTSFESVFNVAIANINDQGGVNGQDLIGVTLDTQLAVEDAPPITDTFTAAVDQGAIAVVGPAASGEVTAMYALAAELQIPFISPSSTAPALSASSIEDMGYMFRNVPDDNIQGVAMSYYLSEIREPTVDNVAVMYEDTAYGDGLRGAFVGEFTANGDVAVQEAFAQGLADDAAADAEIAALAAAMTAEANPPTVIVLVALEQDAIKLANAWDRSTDPIFDNTQFFMTDGARSQGFLDGAPDSVAGMCGTAPTFPTDGLAYTRLKTTFERENPEMTVEQQVFAPNVWDATHLIGLALEHQAHESGGALGGPGLRDAIEPVSKGGQIRRADEWREAISAIRSGTDIDYDGAAGPNDFTGGQAIGPYEVWCVAAGGTTFEQELFLEAAELDSL